MSFLARASPTTLFPIYLLPSIPFRRHRNPSTDSTSSESSVGSPIPSDAAPSPSVFLTGHVSHIRCARCATDLCLTSQVISKGFTGRHGRAYLVSPFPIGANPEITPQRQGSYLPNLPNTHVHKAVPRQLVTGAHTVSDVSCAFCGSVIGWKYDSAEEEGQRYKIGKFILETKKTFESSYWEGQGFAEGTGEVIGVNQVEGGEVEFDSQDEDECEDLFAGVWSPTLALRRRRGKRFGRGAADTDWRRG